MQSDDGCYRFQHKVAYLPKPRMDQVSPEWLDWLKEFGYTGIYLEQDPLGRDRINRKAFHSLQFRLLSLYDLAWSEDRHRYREWVARVCSLCHERDMKVYLALWEPRIPMEAWGVFPDNVRGVAKNKRTISLCSKAPQSLEVYRQMTAAAFANVPDIDGLKLGFNDNDATVCSDDCPQCGSISRAERFGNMFEIILNAVADAGLDREDFHYVLYSWCLHKTEFEKAVDLLDGKEHVTVLGRLNQFAPQYFEGEEIGRIGDISLGTRGVGENFEKERERAAEHGWDIVDMPGFGHTIEYFFQPYTPAPNRVAETLAQLREQGASGYFDYDCGGIYPGVNAEILREDHLRPTSCVETLVTNTLERLYDDNERPQALRAYELAEEGLSARPIGKNREAGFITQVMEHLISMPFDVNDITGVNLRHWVFSFRPCNFFTRKTILLFEGMYKTCSDKWAQALAAISPLEGRKEWGDDLQWEKQVFEVHALASASVYRYICMAQNRLARASGDLSPEEEKERYVQILEEELAAARRYQTLWQGDHRLIGNPNIYLDQLHKRSFPWFDMDRDDPFAFKIRHTEMVLEELKDKNATWDCVPAFETDSGKDAG